MTLWDEVGALVDSTVDALTARAVAAESQLVAVRAELSAARADVVGASKRIDELEGVVETLTTDLVKARARIAELEKPTKPVDPGVLPVWGAPVWRDEFDGDLSKWNVRDNWDTFDTARAMAGNVTIEDGILHIRGTWYPTPLKAGPQGTLTHTTGYLDTRAYKAGDKKFSQQYGRWEIRAKMPAGANTRGALSAFWLRADNHPGEIDVVERWGRGGTMPAAYETYVRDTGWTTFHSNTMGSGSAAVNGKPYAKTFWRHYQNGIPKDAEDTWHTYAFEYTPDYIATFVDGKQVMRVTPTTPDPEVKGRTLAWLWDKDFFGSPFHMRLNLHVGPSAANWGLPDPANRSLTGPLDMQVDYVRVYALPQ